MKIARPDAAGILLSVMTQITAIRTYFDSLADHYSVEREREHSFRSQRDCVLAMLEGRAGRVADIGCGPAVMAADLLERGFEVWATDAAPLMIERGRARLAAHPRAGRLHLSVGDIESLHFPDNFFDAVIAMGVLEYLPDYSVALSELHRILRPGGVLILTVPNQLSEYHLARGAFALARACAKRMLRRPPRASERFVTNRCVPSRLDRTLGRSGFLKLEGRTCNYLVYPLDALHPGLALSVNERLSAMHDVPAFLGTQYIVKAQKRR